MKKIYIALITLFLLAGSASAQVFKVDTLRYKGDITKYINIVIMGDGYTVAEQGKFIADADSLSSSLLSQSPWVHYKNYFNVFAIRVISAESGTKHPNSASDCGSSVPVSNPNTYLGCTFDAYGIHRLVVPMNTSAVAGVLSTNFPNYDQVLVIANSPYYGGSGGSYATSTVELTSKEISAHEIGHSFGSLADEYYAGDVYAGEKANMTKETDPALVKWKNWMGYKSTGIYQHCCGGNSAIWYRPHNDCKMRYLGVPYCPVCSQGIIESIHKLTNPVVTYSPSAGYLNEYDRLLDFKLTELMKPSPNTLQVTWKFDGNIISGNDSVKIDQHPLSTGFHTLIAIITDTSSLLRIDNHANFHGMSITWTIEKTITGLKITAADNRVSCSIYPNPASQVLNVSVDIEKKSNVSIEILSLDGKLVRAITGQVMEAGLYSNAVNIESLASGTYLLVFRIGDLVHTETLVKQ